MKVSFECEECLDEIERLRAGDSLRIKEYHILVAENRKLSAENKWGNVLWDWLREMLSDAGCCVEFDTEDLMQLAAKHGKAKKVKYDPRLHKEICDVDPGEEIWWWGDNQ